MLTYVRLSDLLIGSAVLGLAALALGGTPTFASAPDADLSRFTRKEICMGADAVSIRSFEYEAQQRGETAWSADNVLTITARRLHEGDSITEWHRICDDFKP